MSTTNNRHTDTSTTETALTSLFAAHQPNSDFASELRDRLESRAAQLQRGQMPTSAPSLRHLLAPRRLRLLACGLAVILAAMLAVFHRPVLAAVQQLVPYTYLPEAGFVNRADTNVLTGPTAQLNDGCTLIITQAVASPSSVKVWFYFEGPLPTLPGEPGCPSSVWLETSEDQQIRPWASTCPSATEPTGYLEFHELPADISLPMLIFPPGWEIPLQLVPLTEMETPPATTVYPTDTCTAISDIQLCALVVAVDTQGTHVLLGGDTLSPQLSLDGGLLFLDPRTGENGVHLVDQDGHTFEQISPTDPAIPIETPPWGIEQVTETLHFEPLPLDATDITLQIPAIAVEVPVGQTLDIDIGSTPALGDTFELDLALDVDSEAIHFQQAAIIADPNYGTLLELTGEPISAADDRLITLLNLELPPTPDDSQRTSGSTFEATSGEIRLWFDLEDDHGQLRTGVQSVTVTSGQLTFLGLFELSWQMPTNRGW